MFTADPATLTREGVGRRSLSLLLTLWIVANSIDGARAVIRYQ
jgi:hypothetical protein